MLWRLCCNARKVGNLQLRFASAQVKQMPWQSSKTEKGALVSSQLPNGIKIASCDNDEPLSRVSIFFNAGTRFETPGYRGIVHRVQTLLGSAKEHLSAVRLSFDLASYGAHVNSSIGREWLHYDVTCAREKMPTVLQYFNELVCHTKYEDWFFEEVNEQMHFDNQLLRENYAQALMEMLHSVAYSRSTMGNGLLAPQWTIGKHNGVTTENYMKRMALTESTILIGQGIEHALLADFVADKLHVPKGKPTPFGKSSVEYTGGDKAEESGSPLVHVAIAGEGYTWKDSNRIAAQLVFSNLLADVNSSGRSGLPTPRFLAKVASKIPKKAVGCPFNYFYSDTGLSGFYVATSREYIGELLKTAVGEFKTVLSNGADDIRLQAAKNGTKRKLLMDGAVGNYMQTFLPNQMKFGRDGGVELRTFCTMVDKVTKEDILKVGKKLTEKPLSMAVFGDRSSVPSVAALFS